MNTYDYFSCPIVYTSFVAEVCREFVAHGTVVVKRLVGPYFATYSEQPVGMSADGGGCDIEFLSHLLRVQATGKCL